MNTRLRPADLPAEKEKIMKLSHKNYRAACDRAFSVNMSNPTIYWNSNDGFYVSPSADLVPNSDYCIGQAYYNLNAGGERNFTGSRREYRPLAAGMRAFYAKKPLGTLDDLRDAIHDAEFEFDNQRGD